MVNKMRDIIIETDPEIITGYNILAYDFPYQHGFLANSESCP